jgi:hypothetical protein
LDKLFSETILPATNGRPTTKEIYMRILIPALAAASLMLVALPGYSADDVKAGTTSTKPARALDDGTVKSGGNTDKPARALDDGSVKAGGAGSKPGRAVDDGTVKSGAATDKPARAVDADGKKKKSKKKKPEAN